MKIKNKLVRRLVSLLVAVVTLVVGVPLLKIVTVFVDTHVTDDMLFAAICYLGILGAFVAMWLVVHLALFSDPD